MRALRTQSGSDAMHASARVRATRQGRAAPSHHADACCIGQAALDEVFDARHLIRRLHHTELSSNCLLEDHPAPGRAAVVQALSLIHI